MSQYYDKASGTYKNRDWDEIMLGCVDPRNGKGELLLDRYQNNPRHVKRKDIRRFKKERVEYERKVRQIEELTNYIQFVRDHKDEFAEEEETDYEDEEGKGTK